jgi:RND family efflux transporter MFP subunit
MSDQLTSDLASLKLDRTRPPSGKSPLRTIVAALALAGVLGAGYMYGLPLLEATVFKTEIESTEVLMVSPAQASVELTSAGYVVAQSVSVVSAKVAGKVKVQAVKQGAKVRAGDLMLEIDTADQRAGVAAAESLAAAARAKVLTAEANLLDIEQQARRARALSLEGIGSQATTDDLLAREASIEAQLTSAKADARAQQAIVSAQRVNMASFIVRAPISGTVINKPPQVGEFVGPQPSGIATDMGGVQIADFNTLMVETDVPEQHLSRIKLGGPCEIVLDAFPDKRYRGRAVEFTPQVNRTKATVIVKVAFVDENEGVLPDMAARVSFLTRELDTEAMKSRPKTVVPSNTVLDIQGSKVVFRVEGGVARRTPVTLGPAFGAGFEVIDGVRAGTKLVSGPAPGLADGQRIKEKDAR